MVAVVNSSRSYANSINGKGEGGFLSTRLIAMSPTVIIEVGLEMRYGCCCWR